MTEQNIPMVSITKLQRQLQGMTVLNNINASIHPGDVIGLLGKNGAGKTTLLETLLGFGLPAFGEVRLWGESAHQPGAGTKHRLGYVPQADELLLMMNGEDHLKLYRSLRPRWNQALVDKLCSEWEIPLKRVALRMSVGEKQKLSIVLVLAHEPDLLVLDEPVASLDPLARRKFIQQLVEVAADEKRAIIFSSHIVSDMERIANRIWMLSGNTLAWQQGLDELKESVVKVSWQGEARSRRDIAGILHYEAYGHGASIVCRDWCEARHLQLVQAVGSALQIECLGLEDIFLLFSESEAKV